MTSHSEKSPPLSSQDFIKDICKLVHQGFSFIPFVGCGMSAPSGILMGQDFSDFLAWTMYRVLLDPNSENSNFPARWEMRTNGWPQFPNKDQSERVKKWVRKRFEEICERHGQTATFDEDNNVAGITLNKDPSLHELGPAQLLASLSCPLVPQILLSNKYSAEAINRGVLGAFRSEEQLGEVPARKGYSSTSEDYIVEKGIRALHDWRATLEFLAEVDIHDGRLILGERDTSVIDSFNVHITRDKQHNLGHKMLAHLCRPMRIRVILTTNFDNLIEGAFRRICRPLAVLPVSTEGRLPSPHTVHAQDCIVKMHGEFQETRADFSLNKEPDKEDKERFAEYFNPRSNFKPPHPIGSHLIMMGYSGADLRCIQLIKYLLDTHPETKLFWVCFSESDVKKVRKLFFEKDYKKSLILHQTKRPDLLLYELYQELTLSLPEGGFAYEFTHKVPPERNADDCDKNHIASLQCTLNSTENLLTKSLQICEEDDNLKETAKRHARKAIATKLGESIVDFVRGEDDGNLPQGLQKYAYLTFGEKNGPLEKVHLLDLASGAANALEIAFNKLGNEHFFECVWLELQDYENPVTLAQEMLRVLALRIGQYQQEHVVLFPEGTIPSKEQDQYQATLNHLKSLVEYYNILPERWVFFLYGRDAPGGCSGWDNDIWEKNEYEELNSLLFLFTQVGFQVVYASLTEERFERDQEKANRIKDTQLETTLKNLNLSDARKGTRSQKGAWCEIESLSDKDLVDAEFPLSSRAFKNHIDPSLQKSKIANGTELTLYEPRLEEILKKWLPDSNVDRTEEIEELGGLGNWLVLRLKFLYAITLFRHSRHTSAFYSEAVYSCPKRFNIEGIDNDWIRASRVREWVKELRDLHVFYHKPGGYAWKYRDIRLGLQSLLQKLPLFRSNELKAGPDYLLQIRARIHFWIGDWYRKAFATTGHSVPVMESLYHRYQCAKFAKYAEPYGANGDEEKIREYRLLLFRSAVLEMIKTLRLSRRWMKFWLSGKTIPPMLGDSSKACTELQKWAKTLSKSGKPRTYLRKLINTLQWELDCLTVSLKSEISRNASAKNILQAKVPLHGFIPEESPFSPETVGRYKHDNWDEAFDPILEVNDNSLQKILDDFWHEKNGREELGTNLRKLEQSWLAENASDPGEIYKQIDSMSELAYLYVKRAKMEDHAKMPDKWRPFRWVQVTAICYHAIGLCKHLHPEIQEDAVRLYCKLHTLYGLALAYLGRFFEAQRHINEATALLSKSRAGLEPTGLAIIRLRKAEIFLVEGEVLKEDFERFEKVYLYLDEIKKLYSDLKEKFDDSTELKNSFEDGANEIIRSLFGENQKEWIENILAKLNEEKHSDLSECFIFAVDKIKEEEGENSHSLVEQAIKKLKADIVKTSEEDQSLKREACTQFVRKIGRMHVAVLDSAWSALESAEKLLAGQSHSELWWGRFLALKLRVYGARVDGMEKCAPQVEGSRFEYLAFRRRIDHKAEVVRLFKRGLLVSPNDSYRQLRMIDYFLKAYRAVKTALDGKPSDPKDILAAPELVQEDITKNIEKMLNVMEIPDAEHLLEQYHETIKREVTKSPGS